MASFNWTFLPNEIKQCIVETLPLCDAKSLSRTDKLSYRICLPFTFRDVFIHSLHALHQFLTHVPLKYCCYIRTLSLTTDDISLPSPYNLETRSSAVATFLAASACLEELVLNVHAPLDKSIIPSFAAMYNLRAFTMRNIQDETISPLSERLVTSICLTIPQLHYLSLTRVSRSVMHAPDLHPSNNFDMIPLAEGDEDIPAHPLVGTQLNLPGLLRIKSLRTLCLEESCLGDPAWTNQPPEDSCKLESVKLGTYFLTPEEVHQAQVLTILEHIASYSQDSLTTLNSQSTPIILPYPSPSFANPSIHSSSSLSKLRNLKKLELGREVPLESVLETMETFSQSPISRVVIGCWEDEVVERCQLLEEFLEKRGCGLRSRSSTLSSYESEDDGMTDIDPEDAEPEPRKPYYDSLSQVNINVTSSTPPSAPPLVTSPPLLTNLCSTNSLMLPCTPSERLEQIQATQRLAKLAQSVGVKSQVLVSHSLDDLDLAQGGEDWFGVGEVNKNGRGRSVSLDTGLRQLGFGW